MSKQGEQDAIEVMRKSELRFFWFKVVLLTAFSIVLMFLGFFTILDAINKATEKAVTDAVAQNDVIYCLIIADHNGEKIDQSSIDKCKKDVNEKIEAEKKKKSSTKTVPLSTNNISTPPIQYIPEVDIPEPSPEPSTAEPSAVAEVKTRKSETRINPETGKTQIKYEGDTVWLDVELEP